MLKKRTQPIYKNETKRVNDMNSRHAQNHNGYTETYHRNGNHLFCLRIMSDQLLDVTCALQHTKPQADCTTQELYCSNVCDSQRDTDEVAFTQCDFMCAFLASHRTLRSQTTRTRHTPNEFQTEMLQFRGEIGSEQSCSSLYYCTRNISSFCNRFVTETEHTT